MKFKRICKIIAIVLLVMLPILYALADTISYPSTFQAYKDHCLFTIEYDQIQILDIDCNYLPRLMKVWFLPFQKQKVLDEIQNDVISYLDALIHKQGSPYMKYQVSEDFRHIDVYYEPRSDYDERIAYFPHTEQSKIRAKVHLYHELLHGYGNTDFSGEPIVDVQPYQYRK